MPWSARAAVVSGPSAGWRLSCGRRVLRTPEIWNRTVCAWAIVLVLALLFGGLEFLWPNASFKTSGFDLSTVQPASSGNRQQTPNRWSHSGCFGYPPRLVTATESLGKSKTRASSRSRRDRSPAPLLSLAALASVNGR